MVQSRGMKLFVQAYGCQMSAADAEEMSRPLKARGFSAARTLQEADAVILNTCTVRQHAEDRAVSFIGRLRPWKERRPQRLLIVAGCAAQRLGGWIQERFPFVDLVVGARSIEQYPGLVAEALRRRFDWAAENAGVWPGLRAPEERPASPASAFLTVMRGCNYSCSYCVVPLVRGREAYRPLQAVLEEARERAEGGAREIMLLGQTVNSYRGPGGEDFADLLRALDGVEGLERVRFMSSHPFHLNERMLRAMAECRTACPHLHLPLQSGSDRVLRAMRRNYTAAGFLDKVGRLRRAVPGIAVTTDLIVGFPGEDEDDFGRTLDALDRLDPCSAYCFKFSPRPGTAAAALPERVEEPVIESRHARLLSSVEARTRRHLRAWAGRRARVLLETPSSGRTEHFFRAKVDLPGKPGQIVSGTVAGASDAGLEVARDGKS